MLLNIYSFKYTGFLHHVKHCAYDCFVSLPTVNYPIEAAVINIMKHLVLNQMNTRYHTSRPAVQVLSHLVDKHQYHAYNK